MQGGLLDGTLIAIKKLSSKSCQGTKICKRDQYDHLPLQHPNLMLEVVFDVMIISNAGADLRFKQSSLSSDYVVSIVTSSSESAFDL
ncbi:unnamed protein product [Arabidopsis lyrata]|uniref:Predicted protein n=1 Tax=Arabidopsis lyrata subsp. lyrata TaxID=81972 RepID=D7KFP7_ARALL|nr:predicted protein [Arabidopsis lyrata subsp. lyrata]CAH8254029.1 unnamed protein product [Arabidopsis lyrata]